MQATQYNFENFIMIISESDDACG